MLGGHLRRRARRRPVQDADVVLVGHRASDPWERELLADSAVRELAADELSDLPAAVAELAARVDAVYLHVGTLRAALAVVDGLRRGLAD